MSTPLQVDRQTDGQTSRQMEKQSNKQMGDGQSKILLHSHQNIPKCQQNQALTHSINSDTSSRFKVCGLKDD